MKMYLAGFIEVFDRESLAAIGATVLVLLLGVYLHHVAPEMAEIIFDLLKKLEVVVLATTTTALEVVTLFFHCR
jgi:hypothetical protein